MFQTARWRLVAWNVVVLTLILSVLEVAVYGIFAAHIYDGVDQQLKARQSQDAFYVTVAGEFYTALLNQPGATPMRTIIANPALQVNMSSDCPQEQILPPCPPVDMTPVSTDAMKDARKTGSDIRTVSYRGQPQRVLTFVIGPLAAPLAVVQISRTVWVEHMTLHQLRVFLILGTMLGILLAALGSLFLAGRALVPIHQAFSRQRQFTADASHELRTPLALIRANAEMLCRQAHHLPPEDGEMLVEIIRETDHLNRLVGDLLTLARADATTLKLSSKPVDLRHLVAEVHEDVHRIAESRGIESAAILNGPVTVQGDAVRLRQLLLILLDNALKYTDEGGRVDLALERQDSRVRLTVSDTGAGISARDLPHIFERFYRADVAREHESGGTGLGLAIARWIVQAHQGSIKVESQPGEGTRFLVELAANSNSD